MESTIQQPMQSSADVPVQPTPNPTPNPVSVESPSSLKLPFVIMGLLLIGALASTYYFYNKSIQYEAEISQQKADSAIALLEAKKNLAAAVASSTLPVNPVTITGPVYNSVYIKDLTTFLFTDNQNKVWTVNYQNANFSEYSFSVATAKGTDGLLSTTLQDWLKVQQHVGAAKSLEGAPGTITITGNVQADGSLVSSSIKVNGQ